MSSKLTPRELLDLEYKERVPVFPQEVNIKVTNLFLATQVTRIAVKASTSIKARGVIFVKVYFFT